jgi:hypothetical protein
MRAPQIFLVWGNISYKRPKKIKKIKTSQSQTVSVKPWFTWDGITHWHALSVSFCESFTTLGNFTFKNLEKKFKEIRLILIKI